MINLYINSYIDSEPSRNRDMEFCLKRNLGNSLINNIYRLDSRQYGDAFRFMRLLYENKHDINIYTNSDIFFDDTLSEFVTNPKLIEFMKNMGFLALSRYETDVNGNPTHLHGVEYSQDTWILLGHPNDMLIQTSDFPLGKWASDNKIAATAHAAGYNVKNYCKLIKTYHYHPSNVRRVTGPDDGVPPPHRYVPPEDL